MAEVLIKSIRIRNRYGYSNDTSASGLLSLIPNVDIKIDLYESGRNKRLVRDNTGSVITPSDWKEKTYNSDMSDDEVIFTYLLGRINVSLGNSDPTKRDLPGFPEINNNFYNNRPVTSMDRDFINFYRLNSITTIESNMPFFEIMQSKWSSDFSITKRLFSSDLYSLNNGSTIGVKWFQNGLQKGGLQFSDNWGREIICMDTQDFSVLPPNETSTLNFTRKVNIYPPKGDTITIVKDGTFKILSDIDYTEISEKNWIVNTNSDENRYKSKLDIDSQPDISIINEVISLWRNVPGNESLVICKRSTETIFFNNDNYNVEIYTNDIVKKLDYISPITYTQSEISTQSSGLSQSDMNDMYQPKTLVFNVEKDGYLINTGYGEFKIIGEEFLFVNDGESDDRALLSDVLESEFTGEEEEALITQNDNFVVMNSESLNSIKGYDPENPDEGLSTDENAKYPISKNTDANIKAIINTAKSGGISNEYAIAAMLAICKKESGFVPRNETSYRGTSAQRIKSIFSKFRSYSDSEVDRIKKSDREFFDIIYGGKYGSSPTEGYKYRGRGFNGITFKGNYQKYKGLTGFDIVNDPDLLNTVNVAAKCLVEYFKSNFSKAPSGIKSSYNFSNINSFTNLNDAVGAFYHANAGWGKSISEVKADSTGGRAKAFKYAGPLYNTYLK